MSDAVAVAWKEWRELLGQRGLQGKLGLALYVAVFGIALPAQAGTAWVTSPLIALAWSWVPMFLVTTVIADAFAGERERHTLETLLASRLSDAAILLGKMGAAISYGAAVTTASLALGIGVVNALYARESLVLYPARMLIAMCVLGLLGALFVAALGVVVSLRATTVRQAQQTMGGAILVILLLPAAGVRLLPSAWRDGLMAGPERMAHLAVLGLLAFCALDAGAIAMAFLSFRRTRILAD